MGTLPPRPEIQPAFTYSPEGILTIQREVPDFEFERGPSNVDSQGDIRGSTIIRPADPTVENRRNYIISLLKRTSGAEADAKHLSLHIPEFLDLGHQQSSDTAQFLMNTIHLLIDCGLDGHADRVVQPFVIGRQALGVGVYQQFQRWLNNGGFDRETARRTAVAMAQPLGAEAVEQIEEAEYGHWGPDLQYIWAESAGLTAEVETNEVIVSKTVKRFGREKEKTGKASLVVPTLSYADGAKLDAIPVLKSRTFGVGTHPDDTLMYFFEAKGLEDSRQTLGLFLGLGAMAYEAAQYRGRESAFGSIHWTRPWSKDPTPVAVRH